MKLYIIAAGLFVVGFLVLAVLAAGIMDDTTNKPQSPGAQQPGAQQSGTPATAGGRAAPAQTGEGSSTKRRWVTGPATASLPPGMHLPGSQGSAGAPGSQSSAGASGSQGPLGPPGAQGFPGMPGSSLGTGMPAAPGVPLGPSFPTISTAQPSQGISVPPMQVPVDESRSGAASSPR